MATRADVAATIAAEAGKPLMRRAESHAVSAAVVAAAILAARPQPIPMGVTLRAAILGLTVPIRVMPPRPARQAEAGGAASSCRRADRRSTRGAVACARPHPVTSGVESAAIHIWCSAPLA